ncbi:ABC transporter permease [Allokutzneria sp. A3M-2-11 16]|uniref:ABC transporter permease n=1 Tax=Allokutzneria sp. A3M-2-11 16 TaxID=2962043 RepID=UPI0020B841D5|nr:ABC transporter permease [Allokutzneria sp. A3M-2-11 16]MCP3804561.1 ABC transporter permease [Allokutzneria sp. A3M-2-11 16]
MSTATSAPSPAGPQGPGSSPRLRPVTVPPPLPPLSPRVGLRATARHSFAIARRNLLQVRNDPGQLLDSTLMPMIFTLIFLYVFGGAIWGGREGDYKQFLLPGIMVQTIMFASRATGFTLSMDFGSGVMDRFRALPIARSAVLSGRIIADVCRLLLGQVVMLTFALVIGFSVKTGVLQAIAAVGVVLLYGTALAWVSAFIGLMVKSPNTVQAVGFLWMIPLQFGSSMLVPTETMTPWLRAFAEANPTTLVTDACRNLLIGGPVAGPLAGSLAWCLGLMLIAVPLSIRQYRRR